MTEGKPRFRASNDGSPPQLVHDGLENVVAGLNTGNDKRSHSRFTHSPGSLNWVEIENAYSENWIAEQIVNVPVDDALREWRQFSMDSATDVHAEESRHNLRNKYKLARYWSRLYGGSAIVMLTDQPLEKPLDPQRIQKGGLRNLVVLDRWDIQGFEVNYTDPLEPDYLLPRWYSVKGGQSQIHSSHVIRLEGKELPRRLKALNGGWGDSVLRKVMEDLRDIAGSKNGIASMILESNVDVITRDGLSDELASGDDQAIMQRYAIAAQMKSLVNQLLLDGAETYERKQIQFGGLGEIMDRFMIWMAGAADIPATRLFGQAPQGENATGEGDQNNYYDGLQGLRETEFRPDLERIDEVLVRSALGDMPDDYGWEWPPLYQESGSELAQQELALSQSEDIRINQGVIRPSHVAKRLQAEGRYGLDDAEIERMQEDERGLDEPVDTGTGDPSAEFEAGGGEAVDDPTESLNGAQVTAMLDVIGRIRSGEIKRTTGAQILFTAFPLSFEQANALVAEVEEGVVEPEGDDGDPAE